jgi:hypothetical protein
VLGESHVSQYHSVTVSPFDEPTALALSSATIRPPQGA